VDLAIVRPPLPGDFAPLDPVAAACEKAGVIQGTAIVPSKPLTEGQRAYEAKRAAKAGMSLEKWLAAKEKDAAAEAKAKAKAEEKAREAAKPPKPPGLFARLLERAQKPLGG